MTKYNVTLNFTFEPHSWDDDYDTKNSRAKMAAFERTDKYYEEHDVVDYIKKNDAFSFVENVICDGEVLSAEWDDEEFAIHMVVETDQDEEDLREDLQSNSLEDGEYEACGETGWILFTRGPKGEPFDNPWDMKDVWEYGLTDYRQNDIIITQAKKSKD